MRTPHLDQIGLESSIVFVVETIVIMTSHMVADTSLKHLHGRGAQFFETAGSSKPQIQKGDTERPVRRNSGSAMESAYVKNCVGRRSQSHR